MPITTTCDLRLPSGLSRMGFISTVGAILAASACTACALPNSPPSGVTNEFRDMFCALNGATRSPSCAKMRHNAVAIRDFPACEVVPCTIRTLPISLPPGEDFLDNIFNVAGVVQQFQRGASVECIDHG